MSNQQKQLQSILAEVGINLTENQTLAVLEANELLKCGDPSYSEVMEFKEKYAPKREKYDVIDIKEHEHLDFPYYKTKQNEINRLNPMIMLVREYPQKANPDKCISIEDANKIVSNACSYANHESLASHYNENNQPER